VRSWTGFLFDSQSNTDTGDGCVTDRCFSIWHFLSTDVSAVQNLADSTGDWLRCVWKDVISCVPLTGKYCQRSLCHSESPVSLSSRYSWLVVRSWTGFLFDSQSNSDSRDGCVTDRCLSFWHTLSIPCVSGTNPCWQHEWLTEVHEKRCNILCPVNW